MVLELLAEEEEPEGGFIDPDAELDVEEGFIEDLGSYSPEAATEPGPPDSTPPGR